MRKPPVAELPTVMMFDGFATLAAPQDETTESGR